MPSAPPVIRRLSAQLANQIAAGEVVERPAAVVKELVENSLDAGATRITVRITEGGRRLIEVEDDGHGMRPDDLRLAVDRHATSKLTCADELFRIATLGFRGEALPSIAAVSELELASRTHDTGDGAVLEVAGGLERRFAPTGMAPGTRISVRNLFWNVPARLKFLKSESSETGHVTDSVMRLALGHPRVAFRLEADGREVLDLPTAAALIDRIAQTYGVETAHDLLSVEGRSGDPATAEITGFAGHPRTARPTGKRQTVILNGRFIKDRLIIAAIREGYAGFLEPRLHPAVFLHIDLDPALVDVNVHPAKAEVRFVREGEVFALVRNALQRALGEHQGGFRLLPDGISAPSTTLTGAQPAASTVVHEYRRAIIKPAFPLMPPGIQERYLPATPAVTAVRAAEPTVAFSTGGPVAEIPSSPQPQFSAPAPAPAPALRSQPTGVRRVTQLHDMYLLIETDQGIRLVDQHALHEKALFVALADSATRLDLGGVQELIVPLRVELSAAEAAACVPWLTALGVHGIRCERSGSAHIAVHAFPARLRRLDWASFFTAVAQEGTAAVNSLRERMAHRLACCAAVKAGQRLSADEQLELVDLLYSVEGLEHCPHGRPTTLDLGWDELAKRFQR